MALKNLGVLGTPPEARFDRITRLACQLLDVPMAFIALVDEARLWFKSRRGCEPAQMPRQGALGTHAAFGEQALVVLDARTDPRFREDPLVQHAGVVFFVGCPLKAPGGQRVGSLCALGRSPRTITAGELQALDDLARLAEEQLWVMSTERVLVQVEGERRRFLALAEGLPVGVMELDATGSCTYTNGCWQRITGLSAADAAGEGWKSGLHPSDRGDVLAAWSRAQVELTSFESSFRVVRPSGAVRWVSSLGAPVREQERVVGWVRVDEDITEARSLREALQDSEERLRQIADASSDVFWILDAKTHRMLYVSPAYSRIWRRSVASLLAQPRDWFLAIHPDDRQRVQLTFQQSLDSGVEFEVEFRIQRPDGAIRHILDRGFPVKDEQGRLIRMAGVAADITELQATREQLRRQAETDSLTGALNTGTFRQVLRHELARAARDSGNLSVAVLDIDRFKRVNDEHGHAAGDAVLVYVAKTLRARIRASDVLGRLGGDEFGIILPGCDDRQARQVLDQVLAQVAAQRVTCGADGVEIRVTLSAGVASVTQGHSGSEEIMEQADRALYAAKRAGRNRVSGTLPRVQSGKP